MEKLEVAQTSTRDECRQGCRKFFDFMRFNYVKISKKETEVLKVPFIIAVILLIVGWKVVLPLMILGLFFQFRYSVVGRNNLESVNDVLDRVGRSAEKVKEEITK